MGRKQFLSVLFGLALVFALVFASCDMNVKTETKNAAFPFISEGPLTEGALTYEAQLDNTGTAQFDLQVTATVSDGGTLTYQWYSLDAEFEGEDGEAIEDETQNVYFASVDAAGIYRYYVVVTNTNDGANGNKTAVTRSATVTIIVNDPDDDVYYPVITEHPSNVKAMAGDIPLSVTARLPDKNANPTDPDLQGELRYQWFMSETFSNKDGEPLTGISPGDRTSSVGLGAGTYYVYAVVYNVIKGTASSAAAAVIDATNTKSVASQPAVIEVVEEMSPNATVVVNTSRKYQYVRGFGGMDIPWDNFFSITEEEYEKMYNPDTGLGLNMMRIMIMPENDVDNTDPAKTIEYYVTGGGARPNYIKGVQIVNKYNGYVLASPWSPPPEWKSNTSKDGGGYLITGYYGQYADYLRAYLREMNRLNAPIFAISIQNEPNFVAQYDGCEWSSTEMMNFFVQQGHFTTESPGGEGFVALGEPIIGWGGGKEQPYVLTMNGESANNPNINDAALNNADSASKIDVIGRHTYGDVQVRYTKAFDKGKEVWMTEHNINSGSAINYPNDATWNYVWQFMNDVDVSIRLNDESAFIWWALKRFYSFIGDGSDQGRTVEGMVLPRGYALSHYAKYAKETWRIGVAVSGLLGDRTTGISASNVNNTGFNRDSVAAKVTGFMSADGNAISLVMFTPTLTSGRNGVDLGTVKIQLPAGFTASKVEAMRSTAATKAKSEEVVLSADRNSAYVLLPPGQILSVRFTK